MQQWKRSLISMFYQVAPQQLVFLIHRRLHKDGIANWGNGGVGFLHVPKAAGTSLGHALRIKDPGHLSYRELCGYGRRALVSESVPVLIVFRDPLERLVSAIKYAHINKKNKGFSSIQSLYREVSPGVLEPCHEAHYYRRHFFTRPFSDFLTGADSSDVWVINFQRLQDGFELFCSANGFGRIELPALNTSRSELYVSISSEFRNEFESLYAKDFEVSKRIEGKASLNIRDLDVLFESVS